MRTYALKRGGSPLYLQIYEGIKADILSGAIPAGEKLPSKRALAEHLGVSKLTVETAYSMLLSEGYISSRERSGYFAEEASMPVPARKATGADLREACTDSPGGSSRDTTGNTSSAGGADRSAASAGSTASGSAPPEETGFPFSVWARLMRSVIMSGGGSLLSPAPPHGLRELREAIAGEILRERGVRVDPARIVVGAGTEYFYSQIAQFLGPGLGWAIEDPSYHKIAKSYRRSGAKVFPLKADSQGVIPAGLEASGAGVLHISPAHHYPTGTVMPIARRGELARWLEGNEERYIIEDEYDSEFSFMSRPVPSMQSMDRTGRVIYLNSFSRTLAPSLRMSYMLLPEGLLDAWDERMGFYSCAVPVYEQMALARFIHEGYYERHLRRMNRAFSRARRETAELFVASPASELFELLRQGPGLHFLLRLRRGDGGKALMRRNGGEALRSALAAAGISTPLLSDMYIGEPPEEAFRTAVIGYSLDPERLMRGLNGAAALLS